MRNDHRGGQRRNSRDRPDPLLKVEWCRVIDHPEVDAAIVVYDHNTDFINNTNDNGPQNDMKFFIPDIVGGLYTAFIFSFNSLNDFFIPFLIFLLLLLILLTIILLLTSTFNLLVPVIDLRSRFEILCTTFNTI